MQLTRQLRETSRYFLLAGAIAIACGVFFVIDEWRAQQMNSGTLGLIALLGIVILGGWYGYQRTVHWRSLRKRLLNADFAQSAPTMPMRPLPLWSKIVLWLMWAIILVGFAVSLNGAFVFFFGCFLLAFGIANPQLAQAVADLEAGRVVFYATRDQSRRPTIVRVMPHSNDQFDD